MRAVWCRVQWENLQKEVWWRLTVGGVRAAGGHDICPRVPCVCGFSPPPALPAAERAAALQRHVFWAEDGDVDACPVTSAVVGQLRSAWGPGVALRCEHLWLLRCPAPQRLSDGQWRVVGLAALSERERERERDYASWEACVKEGPVSPEVALRSRVPTIRRGCAPQAPPLSRGACACGAPW